MLNKRLKNLMIPYVKMDIPSRHYTNIEDLFQEIYLFRTKNNIDTIAVQSPVMTYMCFLYSTLNGAFVDMESWEYVKQRGKRIDW